MNTASYRGPGPGRPTGIPLPPERMPLLRGRRLLKRWRWIGVYGPDLSLCVGSVRAGPARQSFWAVWERDSRRLYERTWRSARGVALEPGRVLVDDGATQIDLALDEGEGVEVVAPAGSGYVWTCKQARVPARGQLAIDGRRRDVDSLAAIDDWAGYPNRRTSWLWSNGNGTAADGRALAWNLVVGINDPPVDSERTVWVDGTPSEVGPVTFAGDLSAVTFAEGGELRFASESVRRRSENMVVFRSSYEQPFGTFSGSLPGGIELGEGFGVMERHEAVW
jgi:hypothetical protein